MIDNTNFNARITRIKIQAAIIPSAKNSLIVNKKGNPFNLCSINQTP